MDFSPDYEPTGVHSLPVILEVLLTSPLIPGCTLPLTWLINDTQFHQCHTLILHHFIHF
uniref:Uncharacterized protein n=1 Tax=Anguilla anguilla TaxID=7936 RepID=A0A0E9RD89_ANGAN